MKRILPFLAILAFVSGCYSYGTPVCQARSQNCEQAHGQWLPVWYYTSLQVAQHTNGIPNPHGDQPTENQVLAHGGTPDEAKPFANNTPTKK